MDADGTHARSVVTAEGNDRWMPTWSPDGEHLMFTAADGTEDEGGRPDQWRRGRADRQRVPRCDAVLAPRRLGVRSRVTYPVRQGPLARLEAYAQIDSRSADLRA